MAGESYTAIILKFIKSQNSTGFNFKDPFVKPSLRYVYPLFLFIHATVGLVGIIGNTAMVVVIAKYRLYQDKTFFLITNLAFSDLIKCIVVLPISLAMLLIQNWLFGSFLCFFLPMMQCFPVHASMLTFLMIASDRYRLIVHPFKPRLPAGICIIAVWVAAVCVVLPYAIYIKYIDLESTIGDEFEGVGICYVYVERRIEEYIRAMFVTLFAMPLAVMAFLYVRVSAEIKSKETVRLSAHYSLGKSRKSGTTGGINNTAASSIVSDLENEDSHRASGTITLSLCDHNSSHSHFRAYNSRSECSNSPSPGPGGGGGVGGGIGGGGGKRESCGSGNHAIGTSGASSISNASSKTSTPRRSTLGGDSTSHSRQHLHSSCSQCNSSHHHHHHRDSQSHQSSVGTSPASRRSDNNERSSQDSDEELNLDKEKRTQNYLITMTALFAMCWCPLNILILINYFVHENEDNMGHYDITYILFTWFGFLSTCINPVLFASWRMPDATKDRLRGYFRISNRRCGSSSQNRRYRTRLSTESHGNGAEERMIIEYRNNDHYSSQDV